LKVNIIQRLPFIERYESKQGQEPLSPRANQETGGVM